MAWNFRKRIKIAPGVHLNLSKGGISTSVGPKGAKVTFGKNGTYLNIAIYEGSTLLGVYTSDPTATSTSKVGGTQASPETATGTRELAALGADVTVSSSFTAATKESGGTTVTIVAFADGYNPLCKNSTADISTIDVEYSFTANP